MSDLKLKVAKSTIWVLCEKLSCRAVGFVVGMVLARLLTPTDYGTVALLTIFFAVSTVLVDAGFSEALVQKKNADEMDFNSVFYLNLSLSLIVYCALFFSAPYIAKFYKTPVLTPIIRISATTLIFNAINAVQNAELTRKMLFDRSFRISLITTVVSAVCGLSMALMGYGVWALVWSTVVAGLSGVVARWFIIAWRPSFMFSWMRLGPLFSFGWKMSVSSVLDQFFVNLNGLLIGKFYSKADLAYVNKGHSLPQLAMGLIDDSLGRVSFPALVQLQNEHEKLRETMRRMMRCSTFLVFPLMVGVAICSKTELLLLFGEQWTLATPYMMVACFSFALWPFHTINLKGIVALGRSDIFLRLEIVKKLAKLVFILAFFRMGVFPFVAACAFALGPLSVIINAWPNARLLNYTLKMQFEDVLPTMIICIVEAGTLLCIEFGFGLVGIGFEETHSNLSLVGLLICQLFLGAAVYFSLSWTFRVRAALDYYSIVSPWLKKRCPRLAMWCERGCDGRL